MHSVGTILEDTQKLHEIIDAVNGRTVNLAASSEEIAASVASILHTVNGRTVNLAASSEEIAASVASILHTANEIKEKLNTLGNT